MTYAVGDACWIDLGKPELAAAKVVGTFALPHHPTQHYICEILDNDWPHLEIRDALLMSAEPGQPLAIWCHQSQQKPKGDLSSH
jgi:hypothetical protein